MLPLNESISQIEIYKSLFDHNHDACYALDLEGNFILFNNAAVKITGYSKEEILQMSFIPLVKEECLEKTIKIFDDILQGNSSKFNASIKHKNGHMIDLYITAAPIYIDNKITGIVGTARDITEKNNIEKLLSGQNAVLEMIAKGYPISRIFESIIQLVEEVSDGGKCAILVENDKKLYLGSAPNLPQPYTDMLNGVPIGPMEGSCGSAAYFKRPTFVSDIKNDPLWDHYRDIALENGLRSCWSSPVCDNQNGVLGVFAIYHDKPCVPADEHIQLIEKATHLTSLVIQHYRSEEKINFLAFHDELTKLPNRRFFNNKVNEAIKNKKNGKNEMLGLMFLDLDRFKLINDSLGHSVGDFLLKDVAQRITSCVRDQDLASRQGGDEFTILVHDINQMEAGIIAKRILEELSKPYCINGHEVYITPSIGISLYPLDGSNADELLRKADAAMYQAKKEGRNSYQFYQAEMDKKTYDRLELENELRKALDKNEFTLHYQPIINLSTNKVAGVEALIRWAHPRLGYVPPNRFIPIAEETGMIVSIGEWVLQTAIRQLKQMQSDGLLLSMISINISFRQFYQPNLINIVNQILEESGVDPNRITIEITESMTMDVESASTILHDLKKLGVKISIDDFGTGYSSLSYLKKFPIDYLKIDQSFIRDISKSNYDKNIAMTIILMAQNLGVGVIAEGVETAEQLEFLKLNNCTEAQGYLFSKPLSEKDLKQFLTESS
ncbi:EAL domain-containing protein [Bacillus sp. BRMEA1]|uniref:EAL domain-containing protein n=1 Tax=Neobacillus endophyticus TaxID=2738405 RepID=UPI001563DE8C|nr:EAL domain-containing protein [Neobacillus endophyticus]NRD79422.1 EAL domain-containing protein [Neobacillus endophyticus]